MQKIMSPSDFVVQQSTVQPQSEKEIKVWRALDVLYYEDHIPFNSLTVRKILAKRAWLEEGLVGKTKGDSQGVGSMKIRWAKAREVTTQSVVAKKTSASKHSIEIEQEYQRLLDEAEKKIMALDEELEALKHNHNVVTAKLMTTNKLLISQQRDHSEIETALNATEDRVIAQVQQYYQRIINEQAHKISALETENSDILAELERVNLSN